MRIKSILLASTFAILFATTTTIFAILPPKYLTIKNFQQCLATKNMGTWTAWCLPKTQPEACPNDSWRQLNELTEKNRVPDC